MGQNTESSAVNMPDDQVMLPIAKQVKKASYKHTLVPCPFCSLEIKRSDMDKHKLAAHAIGDVQLVARTAVKSKGAGLCSKCGKQNVETWFFKTTSRGPVQLCARCKKLSLKKAFGPKAQAATRLRNLRQSVNEIRAMLANPAFAPTHKRLGTQLRELEEAIKRTPAPKRRWSPVLPGSYGSGSRG